jgi:hypothetical protein
MLWNNIRERQGRAAGFDVAHKCVTLLNMPSINISQLRDTRRLKAWLRAGKIVELREQDKLIARIVPESEWAEKPAQWPDFAARRKAMFGDRVFPNLIVKDRERD